jgi:hypothetical protein
MKDNFNAKTQREEGERRRRGDKSKCNFYLLPFAFLLEFPLRLGGLGDFALKKISAYA